MIKALRLESMLAALLCTLFSLGAIAQTVTLGTQTGTASTNSLLSTSTTTNNYSKTISIYTASAISTAGGYSSQITKLRWNKQGTGEYTFGDATLNVYLKHVTNNTWPGAPTNWANEVAGATLVYSSNTWSMPTGTGWVEIVLNTPFFWNGTDNLAVFVDFYRPSTPTAAINWAYDATNNANTNATQVSGSAITSLGQLNGNRPLLQLEMLSLAAEDAGVSLLALPVPAPTPGSYSLEATVRNYGTSTLTSTQIGWSVNGVVQAPVSASFVPGLIQGQAAAPLNLGTVALPVGTNLIKAWTESPNGLPDGVTANDTFTLSLTLAGGGYTVGASGDFLNLTQVAAFLSSAQVVSDIAFTLLSDYNGSLETFPVTFNQFSTIGGNWNVSVRPAAGVTGRVTAGTPASNIPLIIFDGVDRLSFDGRPVGGSSIEWTLRNMRAAATYSATVRFLNDATYDTLRYLQIESGNTATTTTAAGTIQFFTSAGSIGNSYNTISNCIIRDRTDAAGIPANAIYSNGSATALNSFNTITDNQIFNFTANGINVTATGNGDGWTLNNNHFYSITTATSAQTAVNFLSAGNGNQVNNNYIGGSAMNAGGSAWTSSGANLLAGIIASFGTGTASTISGNVIRNITRTSTGAATFTGIRNTGGNLTISNNVIGDALTTGSISSSGTGLVAGIEIKNTTAACSVTNNLVANISSTGTGNGIVRGIAYDPGTPFQVVIANNDIHHLSTTGIATGFAGGSVTISGIYTFPTGYCPASQISNNTIHDITAAGTGTAVTIATGLMLTNYAGVVHSNTIYNIQNASSAPAATPAYATGIYARFMDPGVVYNNMISLGNGVANNVQVNGVMITGGDPSPGGAQVYYHNSIVLAGASPASSNVFKRGEAATLTTSHPVKLVNNILSNNMTGAGQHLVYNNPILTPANNWLASDTNLIAAPGTDIGLWGAALHSLPNWTAATLQDAASRAKAAVFVNAPLADLHLTGASLGDPDFAGTPLPEVTTDFDGNARTSMPYIGADENIVFPLPVTLEELRARALGASDAVVSWKAGTETNLHHYGVEASGNAADFISLGQVAANAGPTAGNRYEYTHVQARKMAGAKNVVYYRLKMVSLSGQSEYSPVVAVHFSGAGDAEVSVYPNPLTERCFIAIVSARRLPYQYRITDLSGQVLKTAAGTAEGTLILEETGFKQLAAGNYLLVLTIDGRERQFRLVKQ